MKMCGMSQRALIGVAVLVGLGATRVPAAQRAQITINAAAPGRAENPRMWGLFIENICHDIDGGLYAQMIRNPDFQNEVPPADCKVVHGEWRRRNGHMQWPPHFTRVKNGHDVAWISANGHIHRPPPGGPLLAWKPIKSGGFPVTLTLVKQKPLSAAHPLSLQVKVNSAGGGVANVGYWGMPLKQGRRYALSFYARTSAAPVNLQAGLANAGDTRRFAHTELTIRGAAWKRYRCILKSNGSTYHGAMTLISDGPATFNVNLALMFPVSPKTGRAEFVRADIVKLIRRLHPGFLRFPGGNYIEGYSLDDSYNWRQTVGPMIDRPGHVNYWGYRDTDGFGFLGWLDLAQRINAEPLYCTSAGLLHGAAPTLPGTNLQVYIHEMLSAVAFADNPVTTRWGALRAKSGHPAPFNLKYVEIGNENGGPSYNHNYHIMARVLHQTFPKAIPIADNWGGIPSGHLSMIDDHYYPSQQWFLNHSDQYNGYSRSGPKVFVGEYAVGNTRAKYGDFRSTLAETAFMIGMERNCDVVRLASYGVTLDNAGAGPCPINLIEFNDKTAFGRSSYWVQYLFNHNKPAVVYPTQVQVRGIRKTHLHAPQLFADGGISADGKYLIIKVDNASGRPMPTTIASKGIITAGSRGTAITLHERNPSLDNTFKHPARVVPETSTFAAGGASVRYTFKPYSITVLRLRVTRLARK